MECFDEWDTFPGGKIVVEEEGKKGRKVNGGQGLRWKKGRREGLNMCRKKEVTLAVAHALPFWCRKASKRTHFNDLKHTVKKLIFQSCCPCMIYA